MNTSSEPTSTRGRPGLRRSLSRALIGAALAGLLAGNASAFQAGWRTLTIAGAAPAEPATTALYFPTQAPARAIAMGPFTATVAPSAAPEPTVKGLIVLSHGTGGSELGHSSLAEALARSGYLVAALRHPGDNYQDSSLRTSGFGRYFQERPKQASAVIDALLRDPDWKDRIARDARGPKVGAVGHSAGGYTVLALAGARPDLQRLVDHCARERDDDPIFCGSRTGETALPPMPSLADWRVRAVVALAPLAALFSAESLAAVPVPVAIYAADKDRWLVPRFHADWLAANMPRAQIHRVANAWHFAFMDRPGMPIPTPDGDIGADPPGFDRPAFLKQLATELPAFFDKAFE